MVRSGNGAAWGSLATGLASIATLPLAVYLTRFSESYDLLHAGFAIPIAAALGFVSLALARRARLHSAVALEGRTPGPASVGRVLGESEATASRKLERTRQGLRAAVERRLREIDRLTDAQVALCFDHARTDPAFDLARTLPPPEGRAGGTVKRAEEAESGDGTPSS